ncbi:MAG: hypothetical protein JNJ61_13830 [Anaerolineae bacterium]|nr:hypothetical protein [Anaerolineae bacterium]
MKKFIPLLLLIVLLALGAGISLAQDTTTTATSSVQIFVVICETQAVVNLSGTMEAGLDVYYQIFPAAGGNGTALTNLRQVQVDGAYTFSENISFVGGTVAAGGIGSARVFIAREGNANSVQSDVFVVDDLQDGCNNAQNALGTSVDAGAGATSTTTTAGSNILSPFGGVINPSVVVTPQPLVVIGARSDVTPNRSATPGVLFAECDSYLPGAAPGLLYDTDNIVIFWSWYAKTEQQVQDHVAQAIYEVKLNTAPLVDVQVSPVTQRTSNFWVFYTANIGKLRPGGYGVEFKLSWNQAISDGYDDFGPGTDNILQSATCTFEIKPNPDGIQVTDHSLMYSVR